MKIIRASPLLCTIAALLTVSAWSRPNCSFPTHNRSCRRTQTHANGVSGSADGRKPLIFTNPLLGRRRTTNPNKTVQLASSSSSSSSYNAYDYETGEDEWDRLDRIKREVQTQLGGYRPWSVNTASRRPGQYSWTSRIIMANLLMYGLQMVNPNVTRLFAKRSDLIMSGQELYRLFTPMFLHGSVSHLLLNSYSLGNVGPEVEKLFGSGRFLATYVAGGVIGNMASAYYTPNPSLGASGAVFGLMGAYYTFLSRNEELFGRSGAAAMGRVGSTMGMNILFGMASPSIDNWAHIGGMVGGVAMATTFGPKLYLMGMPSGGRIIVDKPSVRLPPAIEQIPSKVMMRLKRGRRRMQVQRYQSELSAKPWRKTKRWQQQMRPTRSRNFDRKPMYGE